MTTDLTIANLVETIPALRQEVEVFREGSRRRETILQTIGTLLNKHGIATDHTDIAWRVNFTLELLEDKTTEIAALRLENDELTNYGECVYCGWRYKLDALANPPAAVESHWRDCADHPARQELERLRAENDRLKIERDKLAGDLKWTAYELDQCRARAGVMTWQDAAAVGVLNEGEIA